MLVYRQYSPDYIQRLSQADFTLTMPAGAAHVAHVCGLPTTTPYEDPSLVIPHSLRRSIAYLFGSKKLNDTEITWFLTAIDYGWITPSYSSSLKQAPERYSLILPLTTYSYLTQAASDARLTRPKFISRLTPTTLTYPHLNIPPVHVQHQPPYCTQQVVFTHDTAERFISYYHDYHLIPPHAPRTHGYRIAIAVEAILDGLI